MDPDVTMKAAMILGAAQIAKDSVTDMTKRIFGTTADRAGAALANVFFGERARERIEHVVTDSVKMLDDAGQQPQAVPGRVLMPILQACAWEDDETLQRKWSALLANAASQTEANKVLPAYAEILRQLVPKQAEILDWMYPQKTQSLSGHWPNFNREVIESEFRLSKSEYALLITDLNRLQLVEGVRQRVPSPAATPNINFEDAVEQAIEALNERSHYGLINFTSLGIHFIEACTAPACRQSL